MGIPCLADFGLSSIAEDIYSISGSNIASGGSVRWSAPELVGPITAQVDKWVAPTMQSDIYSLAMVIIEVIFRAYAPFVQTLVRLTSCLKVFTGKIPFPDSINVHVVIMIAKGERPQKPPAAETLGLVSTVWKLTEECWNQNPDRRPDIDNVRRRFQVIVDAGLCTGQTTLAELIVTPGLNRWRRTLFTDPKDLWTDWPKRTCSTSHQ